MNGRILEFQFMTTVIILCSQFTCNICEFNFTGLLKYKTGWGVGEKNNNLNLRWLHP